MEDYLFTDRSASILLHMLFSSIVQRSWKSTDQLIFY